MLIANVDTTRPCAIVRCRALTLFIKGLAIDKKEDESHAPKKLWGKLRVGAQQNSIAQALFQVRSL